MTLRGMAIGTIVCLSGFAIGCAAGSAPNDDAAVSPIESYRTGDVFDPAKRVFMRGDVPLMPTALHRECVEDFISRPGNGGQRMVVMPPPRQDWTELVPESEEGRTFQLGDANVQPAVKSDVLAHGYDAIHESMKLPDGTIRAVREQVWLVREHRLMSVNAWTGPAVYLINTSGQHLLMRVKQFSGKDAEKRPLTEFETAALAKLREGDDVVLQSSSREMHVLGAIRARSDCLSCHKVETGALLGAFTYTLNLQSQETPEAVRLKDLSGLSQDERSAVATIESIGGRVKREPGGPIVELYLTHNLAQYLGNAGLWNTFGIPYVRLRDASLNVLAVLPNLQVLDVSHSLVTDAGIGSIAKLKELKKLDVRNTLVTEAGLARLKKELPNCQIRHHSTEPVQP